MPQTQPTLPLQLDQVAPAGGDALIGQKVGEYVIEAPIAAGGMGIVYRAVHPLIGRRVAIKVVRPEMMSDKEQADRFLKEAQALSAIKHRGIIEVIGFGNLGDGRQYMVMEFLEGEPLEAVMEREGPLSPARVLPLIDEILSGLAAAHKAGVVHRDLKPSNVFISLATSGERNVKVLDFGLAKQAPVALEGMTSGEAGAKSSLMAGTPEYIAPEQARGLIATPQTDLYCVGVMLFEMLSGELPFTGTNVVELMKKHVYEPAPRLSSRVNGMPESLDALVAVLLEKEPEKRPASADVARQTVTRILRELREQSTRQAPNPLLTPTASPAAAAVVAKTASATMVTSRLPERITSDTQPANLKDRRPLVVLLLLMLFLFGAAAAWWAFGGSPPEPVAVAVPVVKPPEPTPLPPPAPLEVVKAPEPELEPVALKPTVARARPAAAPPPAAEPQEDTKLVTVPRAPIDFSDCNPDQGWKDGKKRFINTLENTHIELMNKTITGAPDPKVIAKLHRLRDRVEGADSPRQCVDVSEALDTWQRTYNPR